MKGDFTRDSFNPALHYTGVLMQQGRVQLDADWNEQGAIMRRQLRVALADLIGPFGGPSAALGFQITAKTQDEGGAIEIGAGHYYVNGMLCENLAPLAYAAQTGYPFSAETTIERLRKLDKFLLYLDVWERHVSSLEAHGMREIALGGVDTTSRIELVWQVKALPGAVDGDVLALLELPGSARLRARARMPEGPQAACSIQAQARYRGSENQLYRVEIHRSGAARTPKGKTGATFKWSRENGSVIFPVAAIAAGVGSDGTSAVTTVTLASGPRDDKLGLREGDWVELQDDASTLRGDAAALLQVMVSDGLTVVLGGVVAAGLGTSPGLHPLLRRWDHAGAGGDEGALWVTEALASGEWIELEHGVQIQFPKGGPTDTDLHPYRSGDYWLIAARTASGDVEWPSNASGEPLAMAPSGVRHHYAPLASVARSRNGAWSITEQRSGFAALAVKLPSL